MLLALVPWEPFQIESLGLSTQVFLFDCLCFSLFFCPKATNDLHDVITGIV